MANLALCFDFETASNSKTDPLPIELAAVFIDLDKLELIPEERGGVFCTKIIVPDSDMDKVQAKALEVNKRSRESLKEGVECKAAWLSFVDFCQKFNPRKKNEWGNPEAAGYNIAGFDIPICQVLTERYKTPYPFHCRDFHDVMHMSRHLFWGLPRDGEKAPADLKLDTLRDFMGMSKVGAHTALQDVIDTSQVFLRYLKLLSYYAPRVKFKNSFLVG